MEEGKKLKRFFGILALISFLYLLGAAGGIEQNTIPLEAGAIHMAAGLIAFAVFTWLAGGFDYSCTYDKESRPRCSRPKGGKRKSSHRLYQTF